MVDAVFDLSFNTLPEELKPLFRILGLNPGVDFDVSTTAALAGIDADEARHGLDLLYNDHLIEEPVRSRYRLHDLVRDYARGLAPPEDSPDADDAMIRLLAYYLRMTATADRLLRGRGADPAGDPLTTRAEAVAWLDVELPNLIATIEHSVTRHGTEAARLSHVLRGYLARHGYWSQALKLYRTAHCAARQASDRLAEADALCDLGVFHRMSGGYEAAEGCLSKALAVYDEFGNRPGKADALAHIGVVHRMHGRLTAAIQCANQALEIFRELDDSSGVSGALTEISVLHRRLNDYGTARRTAITALEVCREIDDPIRESSALRTPGIAEYSDGLLDAAEVSLTRALLLARKTRFRAGEAEALHHLGLVLYHAGRAEEARSRYVESLEIFTDLGNVRGQIRILDCVGALERDEDPVLARRNHILALRLARAIANPLLEAQAWSGVGHSLVALGDVQRGVRRLRRAVEIYRRIGDDDWRDVDALATELQRGDRGGSGR